MDHGTPDLFGHVSSSKPAKPKKNKAEVTKPAAERYLVVHAPGARPFYVLSASIFAFVLWYVFGAQLTDIMPFDMKELPGPIYGALTFAGLIAGCIWLCADLVVSGTAYFRPNAERRIYGRYRSKWKAWWLRISIPVGCIFLVLFASLLSLHGYWNARTVAIVVSSKLLKPPKLAEDEIAAAPVVPSAVAAIDVDPVVHPPTRYPTEQASSVPVSSPVAHGGEIEPLAPVPFGKKTASSIETGSILPKPSKKTFKTPGVKAVGPLSNSIKEICDWFEWTFGISSR